MKVQECSNQTHKTDSKKRFREAGNVSERISLLKTEQCSRYIFQKLPANLHAAYLTVRDHHIKTGRQYCYFQNKSIVTKIDCRKIVQESLLVNLRGSNRKCKAKLPLAFHWHYFRLVDIGQYCLEDNKGPSCWGTCGRYNKTA